MNHRIGRLFGSLIQQVSNNYFFVCSRDEKLTSYVEFNVHKFTRRKEHSVRRLLCLSESCLIERDPASYSVVCATPLQHVSVVRKPF